MTENRLDQQLNQVTLNNPFAHLGLLPLNKKSGLVLRVWLPDASSVKIIDLVNHKTLGEMEQVSKTGLFELSFPKKRNKFNYKLQVSYAEGETTIVDPYQYKDEAFYAVHHLQTSAKNIYQQLGAQLIELADGTKATRFAVFAPEAQTCSLIGDFNHWDGRKHPMEKTQCGHFVLVMPELGEGDKYKFEIKDATGHVLPHKSDPVGFYQEQYPSFASIVYDHNNYQWQDSAWTGRAKQSMYNKPMSIYEAHLGSWRVKYDNGKVEHYNYQQLIDELIPYVKGMGYTHLELLPISEFPFTGSWGYQPTGMFAPTSRFGHPDEFKAFVDACHQNNLAVIIDWVPAHFPDDGHGLARFDGSHQYEYEDPRRGWHPDWNSCIYDFGKDTVRQFLVASALYWLDKFHIDGLRVDAVASMLYLDYSRNEGEWVPNVDGGNHNYEAISLLRWMNEEVHAKYPNALTIAEESTSFAGVSKPIEHGGLGFDFKWNMGWMHDSLTYISKDPAYRRFHHDDITFAMVYNYDEHFVLPISHDEVVHGKGSMLRKMPGDEWQQAANLRCYAAFMFAHPGKKLNFMGNELGQSEEWNHNMGLAWHLLDYDKHKGIQSLYRELNKVYLGEPALYEMDHKHGGFEWLDHQDAEHSLLCFLRRDSQGNEITVVSNFTPVPRDNYRIGVEREGKYQVLLNTDSEYFWGSNYEVGDNTNSQPQSWQGREHSICLNIPPLSTIFIKQS